jgi:Ni2+-binding GTPase involved in maturation of urease and hydrogenase
MIKNCKLCNKNEIAVYLINGFLGSGKTTFLKNILDSSKNTQSNRIGVLVNEFSSAGIDGEVLRSDDLEIVEINGGSIFCACLKADFVKALADLAFYPIDVLFIECSGMADPSSMETLLSDTQRFAVKKTDIPGRDYTYKGSVCMVDAKEFAEQSDIFIVAEEQVKKSSLTVINKIDTASNEELSQTRDIIKKLNPSAFIFETSYGQVPLEIFEASVVPSSVPVGESTNKCDNRLCAYIIRTSEEYGKMDEYIRRILPLTARLKGFYRNEAGEIYHADCTANTLSISKYGNGGTPEMSLAVIGKDTKRFGGKLYDIWEEVLPYNYFECIYDS